MKKLISLFLFMILAVFLAHPAWALNLSDSTDVGVLDFLEATADLGNSGEPGELNWINEVIFGTDYLENGSNYYTSYDKYDYRPTYYEVYEGNVLQQNTFAFELIGQPEYFLIKFGDGNEYDSHALWINNALLDWGVIELTGDIKSISAFSHWGEAGAAPVPEPSTIVLMGLGLVGLASIGRKKFKS